jgi:hypothetical protein
MPAAMNSPRGGLHVTTSKSCGWDITLAADPTYDSNGRLKTVFATATSKVTCPTKVSDFMFNTASVEKNGVVVKTGKTSSCTQAWCTLTYSHISWLCKARPGISPRSYVFCDGYYRAEGHFSIHLTGGYYWPPPAPKGCTISQHSEVLTCTLYTPSKYIPETG